MKSVESAFATHLTGTVTTLAWCLRLKRTDGEFFYFTSHDAELLVDIDEPDGAQTYSPSNSFRSFSIRFSDDLSVDGTEITAILNEAGVDETELLRGLFDYAEWRLFAVNWNDLTQGILRSGIGRIGEVKIESTGLAKMELRGLAQLLRQRAIVRSIRLEDDADLGDDRNGVPIWPDEVARSTAYAENDYVRATNSSPRNTTLLAGINLGFDTGDLTGWTTNAGTPVVTTGASGVVPHDGTHFVKGNPAGGTWEIEQVIALDDSVIGLDPAKIDAEEYLFNFSIRCAQIQSTNLDTAHVLVEYLDGSSALISAAFDETRDFGGPDTWSKVDFVNSAVPADSRYIRITIGGNEVVEAATMTPCFDSIEGEFSDLSGDGPREAYLTLSNPGLNWAMMGTSSSTLGWTVTVGPWIADDNHGGMVAVYKPFFLLASGGGGGDRSIEQIGTIPLSAIPASEIDSGDVDFVFPAAVANTTVSDPDTYRLLIEALDVNQDLLQVLRDTGDTSFTVWQEWVDVSLSVALPSGTRYVRVTWEVEGFQVLVNHGNPYLVRRTASILTADNYNDVVYRCTTAGTTSPVQPAYDSTVGNTTTDGDAVFEAEEAWTRAVTVASVDSGDPRRLFTVAELDPGSAGSFAPHAGFPDDWFNYGGFTFETGDNAGKTVEIKDFIATDSAGEQTIEFALDAPFNIQVGDKGRCYPGWNKTRSQFRDKFDPNCFMEYNNPTSGLRFHGFPDLPGEGFLNRSPDFKPGSTRVG